MIVLQVVSYIMSFLTMYVYHEINSIEREMFDV